MSDSESNDSLLNDHSDWSALSERLASSGTVKVFLKAREQIAHFDDTQHAHEAQQAEHAEGGQRARPLALCVLKGEADELAPSHEQQGVGQMINRWGFVHDTRHPRDVILNTVSLFAGNRRHAHSHD